MLLSGKNPFPGRDKTQVRNMILLKEIDMTKPQFNNVSKEAKDFIRKALTKDIERRWSAKQLLSHPWLLGLKN